VVSLFLVHLLFIESDIVSTIPLDVKGMTSWLVHLERRQQKMTKTNRQQI